MEGHILRNCPENHKYLQRLQTFKQIGTTAVMIMAGIYNKPTDELEKVVNYLADFFKSIQWQWRHQRIRCLGMWTIGNYWFLTYGTSRLSPRHECCALTRLHDIVASATPRWVHDIVPRRSRGAISCTRARAQYSCRGDNPLISHIFFTSKGSLLPLVLLLG